MNFETIDARDVSLSALGWYKGRIDLENYVVEGGTEICAVYGRVSRRFGVVDVFASSTVEFDGLDVWEVRLAHWQ